MTRIDGLRELFDTYNEDDFKNKLQQITLLIKRNSTKDGFYQYRAHKDWSPIRHELHRASITIAEGCWVEDTVEGTLLHEMIHQYQCEVLNKPPDHKATFTRWANKLEKKYKLDIK
jgi:hypothetical protein